MKIQVQHEGKTIEVEVDLAAAKLVPAERITEESTKRQAAEAQMRALQGEVGTLRSTLDLNSTRLRLAGDAAPSETAAKMARGAYKGFTEGMEKPPTFEEWSDGEGRAFLASLRPGGTPAPAAAPNPAPAPAGAAPTPAPAPSPAPSTSVGTIPAKPGARLTPAQVQAQQAQLLAQRKAAVERGDNKAADALKQQIEGLYANQSGTGA